MRRSPTLPIQALLLGLIAFALAGPATAKPIRIRLATVAPEGTLYYDTLKKMGYLWKKHTNGEVTLKIVPSGVAGNEKAVIRKIKLGTLQAAMVTAGGLAAIDEAVHAVQLPMAFRSTAEFDYVMSKMTPELERIYAERGFVVLFWGEGGWIRFFSKRPYTEPKDVQAEKLWIFAGEPKQVKVWKSAGFNVVPLPETEITTALQSGLVTVLPSTAQAAKVMGWYKHAPHMMEYGFTPMVGATVIDKRVWDQIDPELQSKLLKISRLAGRKLLAKSRPDEAASIRDMKARGLQTHAVPAGSMDAWRNLLQRSKSVLRGVYAPANLYDEVMKHLEDFRKK